jgi:hypothetical protein
MLRFGSASRFALASWILLGVMAAATVAKDLSKYRNFQLGTDLPTIAKKVGASLSQAKAIQLRPALIQELEWRPQSLGSSAQTESVQEVVFSFYSGELFQITVKYDRYETEGMTADDLIGAISAAYGIAERPIPSANAIKEQYGNQEEIVARWQDSEYCFSLIRSSYGPSFRLVGLLKRLEAPVQKSITEAKHLDDQEAPQRDAARMAGEKETERVRLEKSRFVNKPKFRP